MRLPWMGSDFGSEMAFALLATAGIDVEKQRRREQRMCEETLDRCGFKLIPVCRPTEDKPYDTVIVNEKGEPLSLDEKNHLADVFKEVKELYAERLKAAKEAEEAAKRAEAARRQAEYDAVAAPYREERRRRKAEAFAKRQPKGARNG
jgi:hypothetical protein